MRAGAQPLFSFAIASVSRNAMIVWMRSTTPRQSIVFSGHESFPLRFSWLAKAVRGVQKNAGLFTEDDAVVSLGVGKNMVRAIRHWAIRAGVIEMTGDDARGGSYAPTPLGKLIFTTRGTDPYLEDPSTVWLIHWELCSNPELSPTTWYWMFNGLREQSVAPADIAAELIKVAERVSGKKPMLSTVERDVSCFIRSYIPSDPDRRLSQEDTYDSPLTDLSLLRRESESGRIVVDRSPRPNLSAYVFAFTLVEFWQRSVPAADTLSFEEIAYGAGSPGQVFKLPDSATVDLLESLHHCTRGALSFDSTAGLRQVMRHRRIRDSLSLLKLHYHRAGTEELKHAS